MQAKKFVGFADYLLQQQLIDTLVLETLMQHAEPLILALTKQQLISPKILAKHTAAYFNLPLLNANNIDCTKIPYEFIDAKRSQQQLFLPIAKDTQTLQLALVDPTIDILQELTFITQLTINLAIIDSTSFHKLLTSVLDQQLSDDIQSISTNSQNATEPTTIDNQAPIIQFINKTFHDAVVRDASDIHLEPMEQHYRIRFRTDGILQEYQTINHAIASYCVARIKLIAELDVSETRLPQDGRCQYVLEPGKNIDLRVNSLPTHWGEKIVLRLLNNSGSTRSLTKLGLLPTQLTTLQQHLTKPQGLILVTGPTGSGKTATLYSMLSTVNTMEKNICSIEDPIEIHLPGINQVAVNHKTGLVFDNTLRAMLRQDPDILMIGEIRDQATAQTAIRAGHTGHLVLTTLHTNGAIETINRLQHLGISVHDLLSNINLIIAQRLVRCLCPYCKKPAKLNKTQQRLFTKHQLLTDSIYQAQGCEHCYQGYRGRIGIYELLPITTSCISTLATTKLEPGLASHYQEYQIISLEKAALTAVSSGVTDITEIARKVMLNNEK